MSDPRKILIQEFSSYYTADELPSLIQGNLDEWIDTSARRLFHNHRGSAREIAALLRAAAADRSHPIVADLEYASVYDWTDTEDDWAIFQHITRGIAEGMERALGPSGSH
jgi:hypothetical protein